jgi:hypothetical protein
MYAKPGPVQLKHWKRGRVIYRELVACGMPMWAFDDSTSAQRSLVVALNFATQIPPCQRDDKPAHCPAVRIAYDLRCMKRTKPKEVNCPACKDTGFQKGQTTKAAQSQNILRALHKMFWQRAAGEARPSATMIWIGNQTVQSRLATSQ